MVHAHFCVMGDQAILQPLLARCSDPSACRCHGLWPPRATTRHDACMDTAGNDNANDGDTAVRAVTEEAAAVNPPPSATGLQK
jgi:hypothetical protein